MKALDDPISIFLVDDDKMFLRFLRHSLSREFKQDVKLYEFYRGEDCLENLDAEPEIVLLDYYLDYETPRAMNGIEVLKRIKASLTKTSVIMLSAQDKMAIASDSIKYGAYDYITKSESAIIKVKNCIYNIASNIRRARANQRYERLSYFLGFIILCFMILGLIFIAEI